MTRGGIERLTPVTEDDLDEDPRAVLDALRSGPRGERQRVGLVGPYGVWVRVPKLGMATQALGAAARFETTLPDALKEVAICTIGSFYRARFEFAAHRRLAVAAGVDDMALERLRRGQSPGFTGDQALVWELTRALLEQHRIDDALYTRARDLFGEQGLIELVTIVGYYCLVSLTLNAFEIPLVAGMVDPFPDEPG